MSIQPDRIKMTVMHFPQGEWEYMEAGHRWDTSLHLSLLPPLRGDTSA